MSRSNENFVKTQLSAFCKALSKVEAPLKQKHARALIVGTHKQHSARIFWHCVGRIQLEKNPVLTWKFCHLLHKLIRDGHRKVLDDSFPHLSRLTQLGNFWQHLRTSGYGQANTAYCKMLASRLKFHKKYSSILGSLCLSASQLEALMSDINETYELAVDILDQMDELLGLKTTVMNIMDSFRWSSLIPQGQCLLAPLILVILDSSKLYDFLVKALFKLHSKISPDILVGHRERFYDIFRKTKKFYEEASTLQYFKYLVSIPTLPSIAPNFLCASDLDSYQSPQAYLHVEASSESGEASPPDSQSINEDTIIDLTDDSQLFDETALQSTSQSIQHSDPKDEVINALQRDVTNERESKERLLAEARIRIVQYESRLVQMKEEMDAQKLAAETARNELQQLQEKLNNNASREVQNEDLERKITDKEQKFTKLKSVYDNLRQEHITVLTQIRDLKAQTDSHESVLRAKDQELNQVTKALESSKLEHNLVLERVQTSSNDLNETQTRLKMLEAQTAQLTEHAEKIKSEHLLEKAALEQNVKEEVIKRHTDALGGTCAAAILILDQAHEDLQNATSISYPPHLAANSLHLIIDYYNDVLASKLKSTTASNFSSNSLIECSIYFAHRIAQVCVLCAAAAYTTSIPSFEPVNDQSRRVFISAHALFENMKTTVDWSALYDENSFTSLKEDLIRLEELVKTLPSSSNSDSDLEMVGSQLDEEMLRMDAAIQKAVECIEQLQKKSRENTSGIRLEVNDKILDACNALMEAVGVLVRQSRDVQEEIVALGRGSASSNEFYKRNHLWTDGLLSAARAVGVSATVLVNSADGVITGTSKFENLIVAAQEIGASVAQLFVSSRVKAEKNSQRVAKLGAASKRVNSCTAAVVAATKSGQQSLSDEKLLDFTKYSLHEAKKEEMECQIRTLELEAELARERNKLATLRKQHYHLASVVASNDNNGRAE